MKNLYILFFSILFTYAIAGEPGTTSIITQDLQNHIDQKDNSELIRVNIRFVEQANLLARYSQFQKMPENVRRETAVSELKEFSLASQSDLMSFLNTQSSADFKLVHSFWISNMITCYASESLINKLGLRTDIDRIDIDEKRQLLSEQAKPIPFEPSDKSTDEITYNVTKVNADDVWALGYTGEGVIVAVLDVGVNYNHSDLTNHMWESADYPNHGYDFHNNDNDPMDGHGHGTHCAGTVAGDGSAGSQTGMAPDALIMACKVLGDDGSGEESSVWAAVEFSVEQGANVLSLSLGWQHSWNPDRPTWRATFDNALAAGVVASIAAGNEGGSTSNPDDVRTPGDCPPPWLNPDQTLIGGISAVVCVGATDASDNIAYFSSRGPSDWEAVDPFNDYPFNPEMGLIRPDVSAPGVDIKSCSHTNNNGYTLMSGTSMATPGVAGVMALLLSKNMGLTPEDVCMTLETTALDLGDSGKDNVFGAGRVDALAAIDNTSEAGPSYESHVFNDPNGNGEIEAGEAILMSLTMYNGSDLDYSNVDVTVTCESPFITMTDSEENFGNFPIGESIEAVDGFAFDVSDDLPGLENIRFDISATDGTEIWASHFMTMSFGPMLMIGNMQVDDASGNGNGRLDPGETADILVAIHNDGQVEAENVLINLSNSGSYLTFENVDYNIDVLASEGEAMAVFTVTVADDAPEGASEMITIDLTSGVYNDSKEFALVIGLIVEDWETGGFGQFGWSFNGGDWTISENDPYEGNYCSESGGISDNQQTSLILDYEVGANGTISFYRKVSSESGYDYLRFFIDDQEQGSWSGEEAWGMAEFDVTAGDHTFKWQYSKDGSVSNGSDAAWVDYLIFPAMALPSIELEAEANICEDEAYLSAAIAENYESLAWTSLGDGSFDNTEIAEATYTPGPNDISNGNVMLTLTAYGNNGDMSSSVDLIIFSNTLEAPLAPSGATTLCIHPENQTYFSSIGIGEELSWLIDPVEAGTLEAAADTVVVTWAEDFVGQAQISLMVSSLCAESEYSEPLMVNVNPLPTITIDSDVVGCLGQDVEIAASLTGATPWLIDVEGSDALVAEEEVFMFNWLVNQDSTLVINMLSDANGCIDETVVQVAVTAFEAPTVDLGEDISACMNHVINLDAGNEGASYLWSNGEVTQVIAVDTVGIDENFEKIVSVSVSNDYCSTEDAILFSYEDCSGIGEITSIENLNVYPNPNHGKFDISFNSVAIQDVEIKILNMLGAVVYQENLKLEQGEKIHTIDVSDLSAQTYLLIMKTSNGQMVQRLIIE